MQELFPEEVIFLLDCFSAVHTGIDAHLTHVASFTFSPFRHRENDSSVHRLSFAVLCWNSQLQKNSRFLKGIWWKLNLIKTWKGIVSKCSASTEFESSHLSSACKALQKAWMESELHFACFGPKRMCELITIHGCCLGLRYTLLISVPG